MKYLIFGLILALFMIMPVMASDPAPYIEFTADNWTGVVPLTVQFTDQSIGADTWIWNFGDGAANSYVKNPSHTFNSPGNFSVMLNIYAGTGWNGTQHTVNVLTVPVTGGVSGTGTAADPYVIYDTDGWAQMSTDISSLAFKTYWVLGNDIDFQSNRTKSKIIQFSRAINFDGRGYALKNFYNNATVGYNYYEGYYYTAIGMISHAYRVANVRVVNCTLNIENTTRTLASSGGTGWLSGYLDIGLLVGRVAPIKPVTLEPNGVYNIIIDNASVLYIDTDGSNGFLTEPGQGGRNVGGVVGYGAVQNSISFANITMTKPMRIFIYSPGASYTVTDTMGGIQGNYFPITTNAINAGRMTFYGDYIAYPTFVEAGAGRIYKQLSVSPISGRIYNMYIPPVNYK